MGPRGRSVSMTVGAALNRLAAPRLLSVAVALLSEEP